MSKVLQSEITFTNFRDLGGLECAGSMRIRQGKIFRSPALFPKTEADRNYIDSKNLEAIIDLRCDEEMNEKKDYIPFGCEYISAAVLSGAQMPHIIVTKSAKIKTLLLRGSHVDDVYNEKTYSYKIMPFSKDAYTKLFEKLDEGKTIVFHCTEGKDRTGIASMLVESAFGRSREQITQQYLKSSESRHAHRREKLKYLGASERLIDNIFYCENVHEELLDSAFAAILSKYKSIPEFLEREYEITPQRVEKWREFYLEPTHESLTI